MSIRIQFLRDLNRAFANSDTDYITKFVTDDIEWHIVGEPPIKSKVEFIAALTEMDGKEPFDLQIEDIFVTDNRGVVEGFIKSNDGQQYAFCDLYYFSDAEVPTIAKITSYVISLQKKAIKA